MTTARDLALLRIVAQRIAGPGFDTVAEAVGWLAALQAQDFPGALTSIALRTKSRSRLDVEAAFNARQIVRSWPLRGTLHIVQADDLAWMLELNGERVIASVAARHRALEVDEPAIELATQLAIDSLVGGRELSREALLDSWKAAGLLTIPQRGAHLLWVLAHQGVICFGAIRDGKQQIVLLDEWVPNPRKLSRDEALGEWALRYFRSHGPATVADFTWWTKLRAADVRVAVAEASTQLASLEVDGVTYLMDPQTPGLLGSLRTKARGTFLLPGFDELLLGYQNRDAVLPREFADRIVPGGNGMFLPTVISAGRVVGTWKRNRSVAGPAVDAVAFTNFSAATTAAVERAGNCLDH